MAKQSMHAGKSFVVASGQIIGLSIRFLTNIVLAWFLVPADFGIAAIVTTILVGMTLFSDIGIRDSIIRHQKADLDGFNSSAQVLQIIRGFVLYIALILFGPLLSRFYEIDILNACLLLAGASMVIRGFFSTRFYRMEREMNVIPMVMIDVLASFTASMVVILLAYFYRNVWALMFSYPVGELVRVLVSQYYRPSLVNPFKADFTYAKEILSFGKWIFLSTVFTFIIIHSDRLIIGKLVDIGSVGIYHLAASLAAMLFGVTTTLANRVVYPAIASASRNGQRDLSQPLDHLLHGFIPLIASGILFLFAFSPLFFHYLYPDAYHAAGSLAQVMTLTFWFMIIYAMLNLIPIALNQPQISARNSAVTAILRVSLSLLGFYWFELYGFIAGLGAGSLLGFFLLLRWLKKNENLTQTYLLKLSLPIAVIILASLFGGRLFSNQLLFQWIELLLITIGIALYLLSSYRHLMPKLISRLRSVKYFS